MSTPQIEYIVSDCCNAKLDVNEFDRTICTRCEHECGSISFTENYYDEAKADDERMTDEQINDSVNELP